MERVLEQWFKLRFSKKNFGVIFKFRYLKQVFDPIYFSGEYFYSKFIFKYFKQVSFKLNFFKEKNVNYDLINILMRTVIVKENLLFK